MQHRPKVSRFAVFFVVATSVGLMNCKGQAFRARYTDADLLSVDDSQLTPVPGVTNTLTAGNAAAEKGFAPQLNGMPNQGFALNNAPPGYNQVALGKRICISAAYGNTGLETAVLCGKTALCKTFEGMHGRVNWAPNEVCMRADCVPKTNSGLDAPGMQIGTPSAPCNPEVGAPTLFSITQYFERVNRFALGQTRNNNNNSNNNNTNPNSGMGLTSLPPNPYPTNDVRTFYGDKAFAKTSASMGNASISLGGEQLGNAQIFRVEYAAGDANAQGTNSDANAKISVTQTGSPVVVDYSEKGMDIKAIDNILAGESTLGSGPSQAALGLVETKQRVKRTRKGNTFALQGSGGMGPGASVKVFIQQ